MFYGFGYDTFNAIFSFVFLIAVAVIVVVLVKGVAQWHENNESPRLTVEARVEKKEKTYITNSMQMLETLLEHMDIIQLLRLYILLLSKWKAVIK